MEESKDLAYWMSRAAEFNAAALTAINLDKPDEEIDSLILEAAHAMTQYRIMWKAQSRKAEV